MSKFESDRRFTLASYSAGHGLLLFRSGKTTEHPTRIEVLIKDVRAMEIRTWSEGIRIAQVAQDHLAGFKSNPGDMVEIGNRVYSIEGKGWSGFVVGGVMLANEDHEELSGLSPLLEDYAGH